MRRRGWEAWNGCRGQHCGRIQHLEKASIFPSVAYTGGWRRSLGTLQDGSVMSEVKVLKTAERSRWGDYSAI